MDSRPGDDEPGCQCKVGSLADSFELTTLDDELTRGWLEEGESVRALTRRVNVHVLEHVLQAAGVDALEAELDTIYELLQGDDVSDAAHIEKRRQLSRDGVDVDTLETRFVSHQTVYRHLTECLDLEYDHDTTNSVGPALEQIRSVQHRTASVASDRIGRLDTSGHLDHDDYRVRVEVTVTCKRCGSFYELGELLERGGCDCQSN